VTQLVVDSIERQLVQHSAVILNPLWYAQVGEAQALLYRAYTAAADEHLGASNPEGGQSGVSAQPSFAQGLGRAQEATTKAGW
jgi:hypothetical protein